jgi:hypothetical protein
MHSSNNIIQHPDLGAAFAGVALINYFVTLISTQEAFLQGLASLATIAAACVSVFFAIRNRKKVG